MKIIPLTLLTAASVSQASAASGDSAQPSAGNMYQVIIIIALLVFVSLLLVASLVILRAVRAIEYETFHPSPAAAAQPAAPLEYDEWLRLEKAKPSVWNKLLGLRPLEEEGSLVMDEDYDGISELNNPVPAWFMGLFYATLIFAVAYLLNYHVFHWGKLQDDEYRAEIARAKVEQAAYLAKADNQVDESTVKQSAEGSVLADGKSIFAANCIPCHGDHAQGIVGPNLTDEYWLHGGQIGNIFKTIKYGVPEKGMISWENKLSPKQIASVANYILSLKGSRPANAKAPQGEKEG